MNQITPHSPQPSDQFVIHDSSFQAVDFPETDFQEAVCADAYTNAAASEDTSFESNFDRSTSNKQATPNYTQPQPFYSHITEITTANTVHNFGLIIFPIISTLTNKTEPRWITWVSENKQHVSWLKQFDKQCLNLRNVYTTSKEDNLWAIWEALAQGNSQLVVCRANGVSDQQKAHLQTAAELGQCHLLIVGGSHSQR